jgi:hypothetical protein
MPGGLLQVSYVNSLDFPFTSNPSINFFKTVYKRYHNFGTEYQDIHTFDINKNFLQRVSIPRNGDLIKDMYLETFFDSENIENAVYGLGNAMIKEIALEIGGQVIDRQYGEWLNIWSELTIKPGERIGYDNMVGNNSLVPQSNDIKYVRVVTPLQFFFNRNYGLAIPLLALCYHEVQIIITFNNPEYLSKDKSNPIKVIRQPKLFCEFISITEDLRRYFINEPHEYMISIIQKDYEFKTFSNNEDIINISMAFNHPTKEIIIVAQEVDESGNVINPCQFVPIHKHIDNKFILRANDKIIFEGHGEDLLFQQNSRHTNIPRCNRALTTNNSLENKESIKYETNSQYIYSIQFGLDPESYQPNGTLNLSTIDNIRLDIINNSYNKKIKISVFTNSLNILRIMSGMGGLAYAS